MSLRKQGYRLLGRLKRQKQPGYRWPKPRWQRVLRLPFDLVLLHIDLLRAGIFFLIKAPRKKKDCLFCAEPLNANAKVKRCTPAARYGNLAVPKLLCPCIEPPQESVSIWPNCQVIRPSGKIFTRLFGMGLLLVIAWSSVGVGLYLYPPSRRMVAKVFKPNRSVASETQTNATRKQNPTRAAELLQLARTQIEAKEWGKARINLLNARAFDVKNAEIHHELATVYLELEQYAAALNELQTSVTLAPDNLRYLQEFCWLTAAARQPELADPHLDNAPQAVKSKAPYKLLVAVFQLRKNERAAALATLQSIAEDPAAEAPDLLQAASLLLDRFDQPAAALPFAEQALDLQGEDQPTAMLLMAQALRRTGDYPGAASWLKRLEQQGYNEPALKLEQIEQLVWQGKAEDAISQLEALADRNPELSYARVRLASLYLQQQRINEAWRSAKALSEEPEPLMFAQGHVLLANIAMQNRFFGEAITHAEQAIHAVGSNFALQLLLARAAIALDRPMDARAHIEDALALEPDRLDGKLTRAAIDFQLGNETNALASLREVAAMPELPASVLFQLGSIARVHGQSAMAQDAFKRLLKHDPENPVLLQSLIASLSETPDTLELAAEFATHLKTKYPGSIAAAASYGAILLKRAPADLAEHLSTFRTHTEAFPMSAELAAQCGRAHQLAEKTEAAQHYLERALALQPGIPRVQAWLHALTAEPPAE